MFVSYSRMDSGLPIKVWLPDPNELEPGCRTQAENLSKLPFAFRHIALMPDTHQGYGMPIGGVLATRGAIVPNAVGVDIGCGVVFSETSIPASLLDLNNADTHHRPLKEHITGQIMRAIPTGHAHHQTRKESEVLSTFEPNYVVYELMEEAYKAHFQIGTLGGGNHFIELQATPEGRLCVMIHSGSRHLGKKIADHFNKLAKFANARWHSAVPAEWELAFLPTDTAEGQGYLEWMTLAVNFARENRRIMMQRVLEVILEAAMKYGAADAEVRPYDLLDVRHNYADIEHHFKQDVWVHRKGAIRARLGELGIVPGAMGADSYLVEGMGNPESFASCSHGAGRRMSRKEALRQFELSKVLSDLDEKGIVLGKANKEDAADECLGAYKDLDEVMANEADLVKPFMRLRNAGVVIKG